MRLILIALRSKTIFRIAVHHPHEPMPELGEVELPENLIQIQKVYHRPTSTLYLIVTAKSYKLLQEIEAEPNNAFFFTEYRNIHKGGRLHNLIFLTEDMAREKGIPLD